MNNTAKESKTGKTALKVSYDKKLITSYFNEGDLSFDIKSGQHEESVEYRSKLHEFEIMKDADGKIVFTNVNLDSNTCRNGNEDCNLTLSHFDSSKPIKIIYDRLNGTQDYPEVTSLEQCISDGNCGGLADIWLI